MSSILIAQDDQVTRGLLAGWLEDAGYVCATTDTTDALGYACRQSPEVALVTVTSADERGLWVLRTLNGESHHAATVAFTAGEDADAAGAARRVGAFDCLPWPSSRLAVVDSVRRALAWKHANKYAQRTHESMLQAVAAGEARLIDAVREARPPHTAEGVLISAVEAHGRHLFQHAQRVAHSACAVATSLGRPPREVAAIRTAALLHDVGRLALPQSIVESAEPVSDDEAAVLRMHVSVTAAVLASCPSLASASPLAAAMHRRFDEHPYAAGGRAGRIPAGARILAVAHAYDTLVARRGLDDPLTHEEANTELVRRAGTHFDPDIVRAWLELGDQARCS